MCVCVCVFTCVCVRVCLLQGLARNVEKVIYDRFWVWLRSSVRGWEAGEGMVLDPQFRSDGKTRQQHTLGLRRRVIRVKV